MRPILIACVLFLTLLTFYSALKYKSVDIENDITARVTDDLTAANADGVGIDVDGRHVTLSGVVYDEAAEQSYLDVANETYGALGPIDGLTYLADDGFIKAVKTDAGITLTGTVPSEEVRASLLANAAEATSGTVEDNLTVSGRAADWQNEAGFGVAQLAGLSAGALTATAGSYTLSGMAQDDADAVTQAVGEREGWETFVSAPAVAEGLSQQVDDLTAAVAQRDDQIANLSGELGTANDEIEELNAQKKSLDLQRTTLSATVAGLVAERDSVVGERDSVTDELSTLRASLSDTQSDTATLAAQLAAARSDRDTAVDAVKGRDEIIAERDATIEGLNGRIGDMNSQVEALNADNTRLEDELAKRQAALGSTDNQVVALRAQLAENVVSLNGANDEIDTLKGQVATRDRTIANLENNVEQRDETIADTEARIAALSATVVEREGTITVLRGRATSAEAQATNAKSLADGLGGQVETLEAELAALRENQGDAATQIPPLRARVATLEDQVDGYEDLVDNLKNQRTSLQGQVEQLNGTVAQRDGTIAALRARPAPTAPAPAPSNASLAGECTARANAVMEGTQINFRSGTARLDAASTALLERLTGIALACVSDDLSVEIGGHTDNQGSDESNQRLSERRAQAVADFMTERGVSTSGLTAVGYGEANPIASNATPAGRRANRRITFEWQAR